MPSYVAKPTPPNQDKRWKLVDATMRRQGQQARGLIETLHTVQEAFGYLDAQALRYVAMSLRVPLSRAYGVATFYHFFTLKPAGEHTCVICMGTACYIKGAPQLLDAVQQRPRHSPRRNYCRQKSLAAHGPLSGIVRPGAGGCVRPGGRRQGWPATAIREHLKKWTNA